MSHKQIQKSSLQSPTSAEKDSKEHFGASLSPTQKSLSPKEIEEQEFQQNKFEATKLEIQAKHNAITPEGQERLTLLQAKMDTFWQKRLERTGRQNTNLLAIPNLFAPREPSAPQVIQPKLTVGEPGDEYEQEADQVAEQVVNQISPPITQQPNRGKTLQREEMPEGEAVGSESIAVTKSPEVVQRVKIKNPFRSRQTNQPSAPSAPQAAHLLDVNLAARPIINDGYGHSMTFSIDIDAGSNPTGETYNAHEVGDRPHSIHGVSLEYWERIEVLYDFQGGMAVLPAEIQQRKQDEEGKAVKPFSDIYAYNPTALSFYQWRNAVEAASRGEFMGRQTIQFVDRPRVLPRDNHIKRLLQFRVVFKDTYGNRKEILASQIVELADNQLVLLSYNDSVGNSMAIGGQAVPYQNTEGMFGGNYPATVSRNLREFVIRITNGNAANFRDRESEQIAQRIGQDPANIDLASQRTYSELGRLYRNMVRTNTQIMEGKTGLPLPKAGQEYREYAFSDGLLVALVQGTNIIKTYYTNNTTQTVQLRGNQGQPFNIEARSFEEIPYNRPMTLI